MSNIAQLNTGRQLCNLAKLAVANLRAWLCDARMRKRHIEARVLQAIERIWGRVTDPYRSFWPAAQTIADWAGLTLRQVHKALAYLTKIGALIELGLHGRAGRQTKLRRIAIHASLQTAQALNDVQDAPDAPGTPAPRAPHPCPVGTQTTSDLEIKPTATDQASDSRIEPETAQPAWVAVGKKTLSADSAPVLYAPAMAVMPPDAPGPKAPPVTTRPVPGEARAEAGGGRPAPQPCRLKELYAELLESLGIRGPTPTDRQLAHLLTAHRVADIERAWRRQADAARHAPTNDPARKCWAKGWNLRADNVKKALAIAAQRGDAMSPGVLPPATVNHEGDTWYAAWRNQYENAGLAQNDKKPVKSPQPPESEVKASFFARWRQAGFGRD